MTGNYLYMERIDIVEVDLTDEIIAECREVGNHMDTKTAKEHTVYDRNGKKVNRNFVGNLGHAAVELAFMRYGIAYNDSSRLVKYNGGGDKYDILYEDDIIDVKGSTGMPGDYFYNEDMLVFDYQIDDLLEKNISHIIFARTRLDLKKGFVYGVIPVKGPNGFLTLSYPKKLDYDNHAVKSRQLTPFRNYVFRSY